MDIDKLTIGEARAIAAVVRGLCSGTTECGGPTHSIQPGANVFIRTVTHYYTGHVDSVTDSDIVLSDAAWIADTGRFADALESGKFGEVEPYPKGVLAVVSRGAILDWSTWAHDLPRKQKP